VNDCHTNALLTQVIERTCHEGSYDVQGKQVKKQVLNFKYPMEQVSPNCMRNSLVADSHIQNESVLQSKSIHNRRTHWTSQGLLPFQDRNCNHANVYQVSFWSAYDLVPSYVA
jgi:hypothetical protein